ncbi:uncharacterized protein M6B38_178775 [Iris pallida]|uniref:Uncharacterized protein n=1 Tax=Iris pallida TaxID=29817 RepID=A0AAX6EM53_IRIPA|nr:uncharacterized protein M6B38_193610 [Iris pallida]KAJ6805217.1 uncharacterized protein M6B38_178775 [Iris pallida]
MDEISTWILEFVLRQDIPSALLRRLVLLLLPSPSPSPSPSPRLTKTLLLRHLLSLLPKLSTETLDSIELLQTLAPNPNPDLLRSAYLHAAVGATFSSPNFPGAVEDIWTGRVGCLLKSSGASKDALASEELSEWRRRMEAASSRDEAMKEGWDAQGAVDAVAAYARAEFEAMGPTFLEAAAEYLRVLGESTSGAAERQRKGKMMAAGSSRAGSKRRKKKNGVNAKRVCNPILTPEVQKVREALIRSSKALQSVVEDPLPRAKEIADGLMARKSGAGIHVEEPRENSDQSEENRNMVDKSAQAHPADNAPDGIHTEGRCKHPNDATKASLMDRNPTAQTYEWDDDSIDFSSEDGTGQSKKLHLPTQRTKPSSPLKVLEVNQKVKLARGRKRRRWTVLEEDTLREAVNTYGRGKWKKILTSYHEIFEERTEVDLKDKWRNMTR